MSTQYFRITAYYPTENSTVILDSNGKYEKLWQFSSFLLSKGFQILEVSTDEKFLDVNISKAEPEKDKIILRAKTQGKPESITHALNGTTYVAVKVGDKIYIPDKEKKVGAA